MVFAIFLFGLAIGSFLNVLIDRLPRGESVSKGRSHCEKCKKILKWHDLIPVLSFIFLKGKCRYCRTSLSFYYPAVELTTGILFAAVFSFVGGGNINFITIINFITVIYYLLITSSLIVIFFADLKYGIIPDKVVLPAIGAALGYLFLSSQLSTLSYFLSAFGACLFFLFLFLVTRGRGMGFGDVKFAFLMGLILGFPNIIIALYIAFLTGAVLGCILILWGKKKLIGESIPFGPFLVFGTGAALFFGADILKAALHWLRF